MSFVSRYLISSSGTLVTAEDLYSKFLGTYTGLAALEAAHPTASEGSYADVDAGIGNPVVRYLWDTDDTEWVLGAGGGTSEHTHSNKLLLDGITASYTVEEQAKIAAFVVTTQTVRVDRNFLFVEADPEAESGPLGDFIGDTDGDRYFRHEDGLVRKYCFDCFDDEVVVSGDPPEVVATGTGNQYPAGIQTGDLVLVFAGQSGDSAGPDLDYITPPPGFTEPLTQPDPYTAKHSLAQMFYIVAGSPLTGTISTELNAETIVVVVRGQDLTLDPSLVGVSVHMSDTLSDPYVFWDVAHTHATRHSLLLHYGVVKDTLAVSGGIYPYDEEATVSDVSVLYSRTFVTDDEPIGKTTFDGDSEGNGRTQITGGAAGGIATIALIVYGDLAGTLYGGKGVPFTPEMRAKLAALPNLAPWSITTSTVSVDRGFRFALYDHTIEEGELDAPPLDSVFQSTVDGRTYQRLADGSTELLNNLSGEYGEGSCDCCPAEEDPAGATIAETIAGDELNAEVQSLTIQGVGTFEIGDGTTQTEVSHDASLAEMQAAIDAAFSDAVSAVEIVGYAYTSFPTNIDGDVLVLVQIYHSGDTLTSGLTNWTTLLERTGPSCNVRVSARLSTGGLSGDIDPALSSKINAQNAHFCISFRNADFDGIVSKHNSETSDSSTVTFPTLSSMDSARTYFPVAISYSEDGESYGTAFPAGWVSQFTNTFNASVVINTSANTVSGVETLTLTPQPTILNTLNGSKGFVFFAVPQALPGTTVDVTEGVDPVDFVFTFQTAGDQELITISNVDLWNPGPDLTAPSYDDATRPAAGNRGRIIYNLDDGAINVDNGTSWTLADGSLT